MVDDGQFITRRKPGSLPADKPGNLPAEMARRGT